MTKKNYKNNNKIKTKMKTSTRSCLRVTLIRSAHCGKHVIERTQGIKASLDKEDDTGDSQLTERGKKECLLLRDGIKSFVSRNQPTDNLVMAPPVAFTDTDPKAIETGKEVMGTKLNSFDNVVDELKYLLDNRFLDNRLDNRFLDNRRSSDTIVISPVFIFCSASQFAKVFQFLDFGMKMFLAPQVASITVIDIMNHDYSTMLHCFSSTEVVSSDPISKPLFWHNSA